MKKLDRIKLLIDRVIYKTTNKIDGKIYVGQDKYNKSSYFGSGTIIRQMLKKFGKENFTREILAHCNSQEDLSKKERYWIKKLDSTNPIVGYNLATGGTNWYPSYQRVSAYRKKKIYKARSILLSNRWKSKDPTLCSKKVIKRRSKLS